MKKLFLLLVAVLAFAVSVSAQTVTVQGVVYNASDDEPLVGATVQPVGTGTGVVTNIDGEFVIQVPASVKELRVAYVGCEPQVVKVAPKLTIRLKPQNQLETVVVTGYSEKKLGNVVGSVTVVSGDKFVNSPATTFVDALQGQVAGLSILSASGDPSSLENDIRIRGINSLNASNTPLFILDGAPVTATVFNTLNPGDIESISILKDAASTSIYGTRAANGVIVITSKKGKFGNNASVTIRASVGWSQMVQDKVDMMDSYQYMALRDKVGMPLSADAVRAINDFGINTDWRSEIFDGHAPTYNLEGVITGGSDNLSYYIGLSHYDQQGIIDQSGMRRDVLRTNLTARVNSWFRAGLQTNLGYMRSETNNESSAIYSGSGVYITNPMVFIRKAMPYDSPNYYVIEDGKPVFGEKAQYLHYSQMPTPRYIQEGRSVWRNRLTINATLFEQITPLKGLIIRAQQAVDAYDYRLKNYSYPKERLVTPMGDVYDNGVNPGETLSEGINQQSFSRYYSFTYTNTAQYSTTFNDVHNLSVMAGEESIINRSEGFSVLAQGYRLKEMMLLGQGTTAINVGDVGQSLGESTINSFFFTGSYNYAERYFLDFSYRRDGSSLFPKKNRWGDFYSVGAMWNVSGEKFMQPTTKWLEDLRLSVSYGTSGNSGIGNYSYQGLIGSSSVTYNGGTIIGISQIATEDLTWEKVHALDVALKGRLFKRLNFEFDFYNKETVDMLMAIPWSVTTGYGSGIGNIGSMRNTGVDIDLNATIFQSKDWYVGLRANMNYNHNEITKLFQDRDSYTLNNTGTRYQVGHGAGEFYMVRYAGVDPRDGRQQWLTREGNITKVYNEERDAVMLNKSQFAPISGGFGLDLRWKGLALRADFTWAGKKYMTNNDRYFIENSNFITDFNQMTSMLDIWTKPGDITQIPKLGETIQFDDHLLENASFMRMKNLTLSYSLPGDFVRKARLQNVQLHFTGRNLWTVTNYTGYDPEPESNVVTFFYPNTRQYEFGIEVTF